MRSKYIIFFSRIFSKANRKNEPTGCYEEILELFPIIRFNLLEFTCTDVSVFEIFCNSHGYRTTNYITTDIILIPLLFQCAINPAERAVGYGNRSFRFFFFFFITRLHHNVCYYNILYSTHTQFVFKFKRDFLKYVQMNSNRIVLKT